jgi:hypothetical protein
MKKIMILSVLFFALAILISSVDEVNGSPTGPPNGLDVTVINDATSPVPVTGEVEVNNSITGEVEINNTESNPVPVVIDNGVEFVSARDGANNRICGDNIVLYTVPNDKILQITDASGQMFDASDDNLSVSDPGVLVSIYGRNTRTGATIVSGNTLPISGGRTVNLYLGPGDVVVGAVGYCENPVDYIVEFHGRLIDAN